MGELNYFLAGIGSYEAAFFLSTVVVQQLFSATNNLCNWSNLSGRKLCQRIGAASILCKWETSVTGDPVVSTGFEASFLPVRMGTADFSVTGNTLTGRPAVLT